MFLIQTVQRACDVLSQQNLKRSSEIQNQAALLRVWAKERDEELAKKAKEEVRKAKFAFKHYGRPIPQEIQDKMVKLAEEKKKQEAESPPYLKCQ